MTPDPWLAEQAVNSTLMADLIRRQFPHFSYDQLRPLADGWDNTVFLAETPAEGWVFRMPRRAQALPGVAREMSLLPVLSSKLPLPIPVPELLGTPDDSFPWPFFGARLVPGVELPLAQLSEVARIEAATVLGGFLRVLHDPTLIESVRGLPVDPINRADPSKRAPACLSWLDRLDGRGLPYSRSEVREFLTDAALLGPSTEPPVLVHGDLHVRHVLLVDSCVSGVIDWGDICLADPSVDLSLAFAAFSGRAREAFFDAYGTIDADRERRARVLAVFLSAALAEYAADTDQPALLAESLAGLGRAVGR